MFYSSDPWLTPDLLTKIPTIPYFVFIYMFLFEKICKFERGSLERISSER